MTSDAMRRLNGELHEISATYTGRCTWAVTELGTGAHIGHEEDAVMVAASLIKVPVLVALYQAVADGRVALEDRVSYAPEHRALGSGVLSKLSFGVDMTVRDAAVLMMTISDNSASNMCLDIAGIEFVNATMRTLGLNATTVFRRWETRGTRSDGRDWWTSTAREMCALMELIARGKAVSRDASQDMLRIMRRTDYRHELSRELPWNELNMLGDPRESWVAEKGGAYINGVRAGGAVFHGPRGEFAMSAFCEGGTRAGTGRNCEGNVMLGRLGLAAWDALAS